MGECAGRGHAGRGRRRGGERKGELGEAQGRGAKGGAVGEGRTHGAESRDLERDASDPGSGPPAPCAFPVNVLHFKGRSISLGMLAVYWSLWILLG